MDRMMDLTGASDSGDPRSWVHAIALCAVLTWCVVAPVDVGNRIDCSVLCPFRLKRCMKL